MATVSRRNRQQAIEKAPGHAHAKPLAQVPVTAPRRRRRWLWFVPAALLVLLWLLPGIVAHTPLLGWAIRAGAAKLTGTVHVQSASLGWFSPVAASGIEVRDAQNQTVLLAGSATSERWLLGMIWNSSSLGTFRLEKPKLNVAVRNDGSNVEDLLAKYLTSQGPSARVGLTLDIVDGSVTVTDQETRQSWDIDNCQLALSMSQDPGVPIKVETSADLADVQRPGRLALKLSLQSSEAGAVAAADSGAKDSPPLAALGGTTGEVSLETVAVPLAMFQRLAARFIPQMRLEGRLTSKIVAQWGNQSSTAVQADVTTDGFLLGMQSLGKDELKLDRLQAVCRGTMLGHRLEIQQSAVDCDVGSIEATGVLDLDKGMSDLSSALLRQTYEVGGRLDLARLARLLPGTLRIRQGTEITAGQIEVLFSSRPASAAVAGAASAAGSAGPQSGPLPPAVGAMAWRAQLDVSKLTAVDQGRELAWDKPIQCGLTAHDTPDGPVLDSLRCVSDFVNLQASGTPERVAASVSFDLQKLADQLGRFVDLSGVTLTGEGWGTLNWTRSGQAGKTPRADGQVEDLPGGQELAGEIQLRKFQLVAPQRQPWVEDELALTVSVHGGTNLWTDRRVDAAELHVKAGADQIDVKLLQPVLDPRGAWPLDVQMQGQLERWPARLRSFFTLDPWRLGGPFQFAARVTAGQDAIAVEQARLRTTPLVVQGPWLQLREPTAELTASGSWDFGRQRCQIQAATLTTAAVSAQAKDLVLSVPGSGPWEVAGQVEYRGDIDRLRTWFIDSTKPPTWRMTGQLAGTAQLQPSAGRIQARADADVVNFTVTSSGQPFQEPRIHLTALGNYQPQSGILRLEQCELTSAAIGAQAAGQVASKQDQADADLSGKITYDWPKVCGLARPWIGTWIDVTGSGSSPASYRGPFSLAGGQAAANARWDGIKVLGFQIGAGELKTRLADGVLQAEPLDLPCSQGRLLLAPTLRLVAAPAAVPAGGAPAAGFPLELSLPRGPLAQKVQIDPGMCQAALKFVAPVLADVAVAQGAFSLELDGCRIPLGDPAKGEMAGRFIIHTVEVGPGPLVRELAVLLNGGSSAKLKRESVVPFRMVQGRVYHQDLELQFPDLTIRTYGSVGIQDQTLAIMTEMPVPPKWIGKNVLGNALKDKVVRLPLGGTLSRPQLNQQELAKANRELFGNAAKNAIQGEVNKQLERLLGPGR